jgi:hypothetical protein
VLGVPVIRGGGDFDLDAEDVSGFEFDDEIDLQQAVLRGAQLDLRTCSAGAVAGHSPQR